MDGGVSVNLMSYTTCRKLFYFVDRKPTSKMLVDGGVSVNLMPYTTFHKLGKGPGDLIETNMMLKDFWG